MPPNRQPDGTPAPTPPTTLVVLTGNPNCGKTTIFNALTGLRAKVGNYAGVTVERKEGRLRNPPAGRAITILDLPGTYSLSPQSLDEQIARDVLLHRLDGVAAPDLVVIVVDASNLERNLYYATQVLELGYPSVVALNMVDVAGANGHSIDLRRLAEELGVPVIATVASSGRGIKELREHLASAAPPRCPEVTARSFCELPAAAETALASIAAKCRQSTPGGARLEALLLLSGETGGVSGTGLPEVDQAVAAARGQLNAAGFDWAGAPIEARYRRIAAIQAAVTTESEGPRESFSDRLDRLVTHRIWGTLIFVSVMAAMFQSIFTLAPVPMDWIKEGVEAAGQRVGGWLPAGDLNSLLVDGVIAGVGAVIVFLPQILLLFLFIGLLEDTGYMARAAFLMDRLMSKVGLHGKSFIPMLSSFACAIPGIMATRTIETPKDRLVTILVAPLMSCSARLPVYTLLIAACIPNIAVAGFLSLQGLTMLAMYLLGTVVALGMAWLFKKTLLRGQAPLLIMELPPYKRPLARIVLRHMWERSRLFLRRAGTVILGINILLWFLATYPRSAEMTRQYDERRAAIESRAPVFATTAADAETLGREAEHQKQLASLEREEAGARLQYSFAGRMGHAIEPFIAPLGLDWKMGIGIVASFAAREVFVSTMSVVYNVGGGRSASEVTPALADTLREQRRADGTPLYTPLLGVTLMVFYVFALQCVSTVAVVRRETNGWKWPFFQWVYMGALAWGLAFLTWQGGRWLGLG